MPKYEEPKSNPFQCVHDKNMKNQTQIYFNAFKQNMKNQNETRPNASMTKYEKSKSNPFECIYDKI